jgi:predicted nucleotidyltransferase
MVTVKVPTIDKRERIPQESIDEVVRQIVEKFKPQKIILFGSYARGNPRPESDVDLLVVTKNKADTSLDIRRHLDVMFGLDPVVYTLKRLQERLKLEQEQEEKRKWRQQEQEKLEQQQEEKRREQQRGAQK